MTPQRAKVDAVAKRMGYCLVLAVYCCGCAQEEPHRYVPNAAAAQSALNDALLNWQKGQAATGITARKPAVQFADAQHKKDQKLRRFEILAELPFEGARQFDVRLELDNPRQTVKAQYVVFGVDPLWVMRQEDFDMMSRWEHPMQHGTKPAAPAGKPDSAETTKRAEPPKAEPTASTKTAVKKTDSPKTLSAPSSTPTASR